jgi:hypothetical protein
VLHITGSRSYGRIRGGSFSGGTRTGRTIGGRVMDAKGLLRGNAKHISVRNAKGKAGIREERENASEGQIKGLYDAFR